MSLLATGYDLVRYIFMSDQDTPQRRPLKRTPGHYWVQDPGGWRIAFYDALGYWRICGQMVHLHDDFFLSIDEHILTIPNYLTGPGSRENFPQENAKPYTVAQAKRGLGDPKQFQQENAIPLCPPQPTPNNSSLSPTSNFMAKPSPPIS